MFAGGKLVEAAIVAVVVEDVGLAAADIFGEGAAVLGGLPEGDAFEEAGEVAFGNLVGEGVDGETGPADEIDEELGIYFFAGKTAVGPEEEAANVVMGGLAALEVVEHFTEGSAAFSGGAGAGVIGEFAEGDEVLLLAGAVPFGALLVYAAVLAVAAGVAEVAYYEFAGSETGYPLFTALDGSFDVSLCHRITLSLKVKLFLLSI